MKIYQLIETSQWTNDNPLDSKELEIAFQLNKLTSLFFHFKLKLERIGVKYKTVIMVAISSIFFNIKLYTSIYAREKRIYAREKSLKQNTDIYKTINMNIDNLSSSINVINNPEITKLWNKYKHLIENVLDDIKKLEK